MDAEEVLAELRRELKKFEEGSRRVEQLVDTLVQLGVYPTDTPAQQKYGYSPLRMAQFWGADWHEWRKPLNCPHCNADLRDHTNGPPFKREIGIYDRGFDRTVSYQCPECRKQWPVDWVEELTPQAKERLGL